VPAAQRAHQDEDDRECDKRLRAKSQRTYHRNRGGPRTQVPARLAGNQAVRQTGGQEVRGSGSQALQREKVPSTG
jgi:hypothetical protein